MFPCLLFLYQSVTCLPMPFHFDVLPIYDISPLLPMSIYLLAFCSSLISPLLLWFLLFLFPILVFLTPPGSAIGRLPRSSHELRLFYRPIVFIIYLFISYTFYLIFFFLLPHCLYIWFPLSPLPVPVRNFPSRSAFLQRNTDNYSISVSCHLHQLLYKNRGLM